MTLPDQASRDRISASLDETLIVEAAAGTGKTSEIVRRIIAVLASGRATIDSIVTVTFTVKAAGELKLRLRAELENERHGAPSGDIRRRLEQALQQLEYARVSTIHGFCADLLRERPVEAGVDPAFATMPEPQAVRLFRDTFQKWIQGRLQDPPEGLRRILRRTGRSGGVMDDLQRAAFQLSAWRDYPAPWRREPFLREAAVDVLTEQLRRFAAMTARCPDTWDLDHVSRTNQWQLLHGADTAAEHHFSRLAGLESGTVVLWQHLDRLVMGQRVDNERAQRLFLGRATRVCDHLAMVFHDLMKGHGALELSVNGRALSPWDPYLQDEPATQTLPVTRLTMRDSVVEVRPYVLPHHSKMSAARFAAGSGPNGWNAHQGFYVYRAGRLLVPGDWLGFGWAKEEHHKLARIRVRVYESVVACGFAALISSRAFILTLDRDEALEHASYSPERVRRSRNAYWPVRGWTGFVAFPFASAFVSVIPCRRPSENVFRT